MSNAFGVVLDSASARRAAVEGVPETVIAAIYLLHERSENVRVVISGTRRAQVRPLCLLKHVLTTSFLHRLPILKGSFDRTKIARIAIIAMLLDGGPCPCKSAEPGLWHFLRELQ
jgi:hypothetical protein